TTSVGPGGSAARWVPRRRGGAAPAVTPTPPSGPAVRLAHTLSVPGEVDGENLEHAGAPRRLHLHLVPDRLPDERPRDGRADRAPAGVANTPAASSVFAATSIEPSRAVDSAGPSGNSPRDSARAAHCTMRQSKPMTRRDLLRRAPALAAVLAVAALDRRGGTPSPGARTRPGTVRAAAAQGQEGLPAPPAVVQAPLPSLG